MLKIHFIQGIRKLIKDRFYSLINVSGLAIGLASCFLIILYIQDELSYDRFHEKSGQIYRICALGSIGNTPINQVYTCAPLPAAMIADYPEVIQAVRISGKWDAVLEYQDKTFYEDQVLAVDSTFFDVFSFRLLEGDPTTILREPNTVVITESTARKYFGKEDATGKMLNLIQEEEDAIKVVGVVEDVPHNAHFHFDFLLSLSTFESSRSESWWNNNFKTYLVLQEGFDYRELENKLPDFIRKYLSGDIAQWDEWLEAGNYWKYILQPLEKIHLTSDLNGEIEPNGNLQYIYIFSFVGLIILLIACINFMNLSTARSASRAREVGVKKVAGSPRSSLVSQFLIETVIFALLAGMVAVLIILLILPFFNQLTQKAFSVQDIFTPAGILILLGLMGIVSILAGSYPAIHLSSFPPTVIFQGLSQTGRGKSILRAMLVVFQFSLSIILMAGTFIVYSQLEYFQKKELGFSKEQILILQRPESLGGKVSAFKEKLLQHAAIPWVTSSSAVMGLDFNNWGCHFEGHEDNHWSTLNMFVVDHDFQKTFSMQMDAGRFFSRDFPTDSSGIVINQAAASLFNTNDVMGRKITFGGQYEFRVIGTMEDFHYESFHQHIRPAGMLLLPGIWGIREDFISIRVSGENLPGTIRFIEDQWKEFTGGLPIQYSFFDREYDQLYQNEKRTGKIMTLFSVIALFIASLGLLGLVAFTTEQRTKEIGIRKVQGASIQKILLHLWKDFGRWILISTLIAIPVTWYLMNNWLQNFAYRIDFSWWSLVIAAILAMVIAVMTVSYQTLKAARINPAESLRYE
jgi:putative ABC transport system permease protein